MDDFERDLRRMLNDRAATGRGGQGNAGPRGRGETGGTKKTLR